MRPRLDTLQSTARSAVGARLPLHSAGVAARHCSGLAETANHAWLPLGHPQDSKRSVSRWKMRIARVRRTFQARSTHSDGRHPNLTTRQGLASSGNMSPCTSTRGPLSHANGGGGCGAQRWTCRQCPRPCGCRAHAARRPVDIRCTMADSVGTHPPRVEGDSKPLP